MFVNDVVSVIRILWTGRFLFLVPGGLLMLVSTAYGADSVNLTLNYTVIQGTCTVDVQTDSGNTLDFGDVVAEKKNSEWAPMTLSGGATYKPFTVQLTACSGSVDASTTPALTIDGETLSNDGTNNKSYLFVNSSASTAKGLGFVIYSSGTPNPGKNEVSTVSTNYTDSYIPIPNYGKGTALNGSVSVPLAAAVSCGKTCKTSSSSMRAGTLTGAVTFSFIYH